MYCIKSKNAHQHCARPIWLCDLIHLQLCFRYVVEGITWLRCKRLKMKQYGNEEWDARWKFVLEWSKSVASQICREYPETYFGFEIFEIRWNFENWKIFVAVHINTDEHHSDQISHSASWDGATKQKKEQESLPPLCRTSPHSVI